MRNSYIILPILILLTFFSCSEQKPRGQDKDHITQRVDSVLSLMTLEEKVGQMVQYTSGWDVTGPVIDENYQEYIRKGMVGSVFNAHTANYNRNLQRIAVEETRLGIPLIFGYDVIHGYKTIFPISLGEAASWDLEAIELSARIAAEEASASGLHWTFAPMVDISYDPRWGRISEGAGEDAYLGSLIAQARVRGFQGDDLGAVNTLVACAKHFAAYGAAQAGRDYHTVDMSERVLREYYFPPFKAALDAGVKTFMASFNEYDGTPATGNSFLFREVLEKEWGFEGFVVSDYTGINEMIPHGFSKDLAHAASQAAIAGVHMDMQGGAYMNHLVDEVKNGRVSELEIDEAVARILRVKFELGLFDDPYRYSNEKREKETIMKAEFLESARDIARKSIVLLKNDKRTLPLSSKVSKIALIGPLADTKEVLGSWHGSGSYEDAVGLAEGLRNQLPASSIVVSKGTDFNTKDKSEFASAINAARNADVVIMALGESEHMGGEAASRSEIGLPGNQLDLFFEIKKIGKPIIVVLMNSRPLAIPELDEHADAILETWFLGTQAGNAIADVILGKYNPSGKLPVTFPRNVGQIPIHYNMKNTGRPIVESEKYTSKYLDVPNTPLYPFGYGLSYTNFGYSNLKLSQNTLNTEGKIQVIVDVQNTGDVEGTEIVQLYVKDVVGSVTRPVRELKGFQKILLKAGEKKTVQFDITERDLRFYRNDMSFGSEPGEFEIYVGTDSNATLKASFSLM